MSDTARMTTPIAAEKDVAPCEAPCPKCGNADIVRNFFARGDEVKAKEYNERPHEWTVGQCWRYTADRDHIRNHCRCCHYEWNLKPLAKPKPARATAARLSEP